MILAFQMTKKTEVPQFKTPTKRALGVTYTTPTPNKIKKVLIYSLRMFCAKTSILSNSTWKKPKQK